MRKLFLAAFAALAFGSCAKENTTTVTGENGPGNVCITFSQDADAPGSRAFFGATASAETWEKQINQMAIFVFGTSDGSLVIRRTMTAAELAAGKINFALPWTAVDNNASFYAVANYTIPETVTTEAGLKALLDDAPGVYNGTTAEVTDRAKRAGGFVMSAYKAVSLITTGVNNVALNLKRTVAKIAVRVTPAADFSERFMGAKIRVQSVEIIKAARQTAVIAPAAPAAGAFDYSLSQTSQMNGDTGDNLFYIFENGTRAAADMVALKLTAVYDPDGNFGTKNDQIEMFYNVPIVQADNTGAIKRNGYYRINMVINGLTGHDCTATVTVEDWETPVTQDVSLGK